MFESIRTWTFSTPASPRLRRAHVVQHTPAGALRAGVAPGAFRELRPAVAPRGNMEPARIVVYYR